VKVALEKYCFLLHSYLVKVERLVLFHVAAKIWISVQIKSAGCPRLSKIDEDKIKINI